MSKYPVCLDSLGYLGTHIPPQHLTPPSEWEEVGLLAHSDLRNLVGNHQEGALQPELRWRWNLLLLQVTSLSHPTADTPVPA